MERMGSMSSVQSSEVGDCYLMKRTRSNLSDFELPEPPKKRLKILTPGLLSALDRTGVTDERAAYIIAETAKGLGHNLDNIILSSSTIRRERIEHRKKFTTKLKAQLQVESVLTLGFDGKILQDLTGIGKVDRVPVVVSGVNTSHLLGVPKMSSGTGLNQAMAILKVLEEWKLTDRIKALTFDTTAVNTGILLL